MRPLRRLTVCVLAAAAALAAGCGGYRGASSGKNRDLVPDQPAPPPAAVVRRLTPPQAADRIRRGGDLFLLCVATKEEYDHGHVAGSVLIPAAALRSKLDHNDLYPEINRGRVPRKDQPVVLYCWWKPCDCPLIPTYSGLAYQVLHERGYRDVTVIDGGMRAWIKADLPVERAAPPK